MYNVWTHGYAVQAIANNLRTFSLLEKSGVFEKVHNQTEFLYEHATSDRNDEGLAAKFDELEAECQEAVASRMIYSDRLLGPTPFGVAHLKRKRFTFEELQGINHALYRFWHDFYENEKPDLIIGEISNASEFMSYHMAARYGCRHIVFVPTRIMKKRFLICNNPLEDIPLLKNEYAKIKDEGPGPEGLVEARKFVDEFMERKTKSFISRNPLSLDISNAMRLTRIYRERSRIAVDRPEALEYELDGSDAVSFALLVAHRIVKSVRYAVSKMYFERNRPEGKYFFFGLQNSPENSLLVRGLFYNNQIALIENICKSLPSGYRLVVKDHPGIGGRRKLGFFRELKKIPSVYLVSPETDSHDLIVNSAGAITIGGTVGLECIMYGKPVITVGNSYYNCFDNVHVARNITELSGLIRKAISEYRFDPELMLRFIEAVRRASYKGFIVSDITQEGATYFGQENISDFADAIAHHMQNN